MDQSIASTLAAGDAASEDARCLTAESAEALKSSGYLSTFVPRRYGGGELTLEVMAERVRECSRYSTSAGWVLMVSLAHDFVIGSFPEEAQDDVWAPGPDDVTPGSLAPGGRIEPTDGGWLASGRWPFNSGAIYGKWFLLGAVDRSGETPKLYHLVVPKEDLVLDDDWRPLGLRGTGSVDAVAEKIFVPEYRSIDSAVLLGARSEAAARQETTLYKTPILPCLAAHIATTMLAFARPAFEEAVKIVADQKDKYTLKPKADRPGLQFRMAESAAEIRSAEFMLADTLTLLGEMANGADTIANRARAKFQAAYIGRTCRQAIDRLIGGTGARSVFDGSPIQRAFRDIVMASNHELVNFDGSALTYGRTIAGLDIGNTPI